jgi:phosphonate transport system substrate-binding protein
LLDGSWIAEDMSVKTVSISVMVLLVGLVFGLLMLLGEEPAPPIAHSAPATQEALPLRIGLIPERDVFALRERNRVLADYLAEQLHRPVRLVTANSYDAILKDFAEKQVDVAFLGSLVTVLCVDRLHAQVLLKSELPGNVMGYRGVVCVREDGPVRRISDLVGHSMALVRTTTAGNLFPFYELSQHGLLGVGKMPRIVWVGTHDDAISLLEEGAVDAAGVKDLRLTAWKESHPGSKLRVLSTSELVPENALVIRGDLAGELGPVLVKALSGMEDTPDGRKALASYGVRRFRPCGIEEYRPVYDMVDALGPLWSHLVIEGPPPHGNAEH